MKRYKMFLLVSILCVMFSACSNKKPHKNEESDPWEISANELSIAEQNTITMTLDADTLSDAGASFLLKNEGKEDVTYGSACFLQVQMEDVWYQIEKNVDWTLEGYELAAGTEEVLSVEWAKVYGILPAGNYRLVKQFSVGEERIYVACPFTIEEKEL